MNRCIIAVSIAILNCTALHGAEKDVRPLAVAWVEAEPASDGPGIEIDRSEPATTGDRTRGTEEIQDTTTSASDLRDAILQRSKALSDDYFYDPDIAASRLKELAGVSFSFGMTGLDELVTGSALSMIDRVLPNGALVESFGEIRGARRYGLGVFARSVGEYTSPIAALGRPDLAVQCMRFVLAHTPPDQEHVPHVFDLDGSVKSNAIQVDSIGHAFYGAYHRWLFTGDLHLFNDYKHDYDLWLSALEDRFLIPRYNLVQSGNMNENIDGSTRPMCELFTNCVVFHGCKMMAKMMALSGDVLRAKKADALAERILSGVRTHLVGGHPPMYQLGFYLGPENDKELLPDGMFKWANTFSSRHLLGRCDADVLRNTHEELVSRSLADFGKYRIPLGYSKPEMCLIGKYAGWYLGYTARTGRYKDLDTMLHFIAEYTQKPRDILPEGWILHDPGWVKEETERAKTEGHRWVAFDDDPSGDYTMDSGNGEQLMLSVEHIIREVIGIDYRNGIPGIHPAFPPSLKSVRMEGMLLPTGDGSTGRVTYEFTQASGSCCLKVSEMPECALQLSVPVPKVRPLCVRLNGKNIEPESMEIGLEADRVSVRASGSRQALLEVSWQPTQ